MSSVTRFPNGVSNYGEESMFADVQLLDQSRYHVFFDDFDGIVFDSNNWTDAGQGIQLLSQEGGIASILSTSGQVILKREQQTFDVAPGQEVWFQTRIRAVPQGESLSPSVFFCGMLNDSGFQGLMIGNFAVSPSPAVSSTLKLYIGGTPATPVDLGPYPSGEFFDVGLKTNKDYTVSVYVNGVKVVNTPFTGFTPSLETALLGPTVGALKLENDSQVEVDYVLACKER